MPDNNPTDRPFASPHALTYRAAGPRGPSRRAAVVRWAMLGLAVLIFQAAVVVLLNPTLGIHERLGGGIIGTPFAPLRDYQSAEEEMKWWYLAKALVFLAVFLGSQWLLLKRRGSWRIEMLGLGPLTRRSAVVLGLIAMLVSIGLLATLMEIPNWWTRMTLVSGSYMGERVISQRFGVVWVVMGMVWVAWSIVFWRYARTRDHYTALSKITRGLFAGSILEMLVAAPAHVWVLRKYGEDDCYCTRGSYTGVVFGCTAIVWLFGPGVVLLFMRERRRRERLHDEAVTKALTTTTEPHSPSLT